MNSNSYDIIVIGGGAIGLSAAYHCARQGRRVLLLEQFGFFNQSGSSAGHNRMWRVMYSEVYLAQLALQTSPMWEQLEQELNETLIDRTGLLNFGIDTPYTPEGSMESAKQVMDELKIPYTQLTSKEIQEQYPFKNLPSEYYGLYQANGGTINVGAVLRGLFTLAQKSGATLRELEPVVNVASGPIGVTVNTNKGTYTANKVIVCAGAYVNEVLQSLNVRIRLEVWEMTYAYYQVLDETIKYPMWFQFDLPPASGGSNLFYGFPSEPWARPGFLRLAVDYASRVMSSPSQRTFVPSAEDIHLTMNYIQRHMIGVATTPTEMTTCLVPLVPDNGYVLDFAPPFVPDNENVLICTAGWAFKFTPMFGKILAQLAIDGTTEYNIEPMKITRKGVLDASA